MVAFTTDNPFNVTELGAVPMVDLDNGEAVIGLDTRPSDGALIAVTNLGRILKLDGFDGEGPLTSTALQSVTPPAGILRDVEYGVDFNPAVGTGALRIISEFGENFRVVPGALVSPPPAAAVATVRDGDIGYAVTGLSGLARHSSLDFGDSEPRLSEPRLYALDTSVGGGRLLATDALVPTALEGEPQPTIEQLNAQRAALIQFGSLRPSNEVIRPDNGFAVVVLNSESFEEEGWAALATTNANGIFSAGIYRVALDPFNADIQNLAGERQILLSFTRAYQGLIVRRGSTSPDSRQFRVLRAGGPNQSLVIFEIEDANNPSLPSLLGVDTLENRFSITGLGDAPLIGLTDRVFFDPNVGERREMWAVDAAGRLFRLSEPAPSTATISATLVATMSELPDGDSFGFSFDRANQSFILVSNTGQVLTVNDALSGTTVARKPFRQIREFRFSEFFPGVLGERISSTIVATAYRETNFGENGFQFVIDQATNCLLKVTTPNDGLLEEPRFANCGGLTPSGFPLAPFLPQSVDIAPDAAGGEAFAAFNLSGEDRSRLFAIDLETGEGRNLGFIGDASDARVRALTLRTD